MAFDRLNPVGFTFLYQPGDSPKPHLYVVVTKPDESCRVIAVNISTGQNYVEGDDKCHLEPGEHPFITDPSSVLYSKALELHVSQIEKGLQFESMVEKERANRGLVAKIREGARDNDALSNRFITLLTTQSVAPTVVSGRTSA